MLAAAVLVGSGLAPQAQTIPVAPRSLAVTAGRGEAVLFDTDAKGERIPDAAKPGRERVVYKKTARLLRWAVVVGTVDFRAIRRAVPDPPPELKAFCSLLGVKAAPQWGDYLLWWPCRRIDLERREHLAGAGWSDWTPVDTDVNLNILDNLTRIESERVRREALPDAFVDPLPYLKSGEWRGVDADALVDPSLRDARRRVPPRGLFDLLSDPPVPAPALKGAPAPFVVADEVMIRSIDFTAQPGAIYQYRARVVVFSLAPKHTEMFGPWTDPTGEVTIPKE
jgi:hypothetical protein